MPTNLQLILAIVGTLFTLFVPLVLLFLQQRYKTRDERRRWNLDHRAEVYPPFIALANRIRLELTDIANPKAPWAVPADQRNEDWEREHWEKVRAAIDDFQAAHHAAMIWASIPVMKAMDEILAGVTQMRRLAQHRDETIEFDVVRRTCRNASTRS